MPCSSYSVLQRCSKGVLGINKRFVLPLNNSGRVRKEEKQQTKRNHTWMLNICSCAHSGLAPLYFHSYTVEGSVSQLPQLLGKRYWGMGFVFHGTLKFRFEHLQSLTAIPSTAQIPNVQASTHDYHAVVQKQSGHWLSAAVVGQTALSAHAGWGNIGQAQPQLHKMTREEPVAKRESSRDILVHVNHCWGAAAPTSPLQLLLSSSSHSLHRQGKEGSQNNTGRMPSCIQHVKGMALPT